MFADIEILCVSVVDSHRFQCGSGSGILCKCESRSGSNTGSRSLVLMAKFLNFTAEKNLNLNERRPSYMRSPQHLQKRTSSISSFFTVLFIFFVLALLDPDPTGQNQSESIRIRMSNTGLLNITYLCISAGLVGDVECVLALDALRLSAGVAEAPGRSYQVRHPTAAPLLHTAVRMLCTVERLL